MYSLAKEFIFEMIGTTILMLLGVSGSACSVLSRSSTNIQCGFAYAFGVVIASILAGPVSGGHINPAITLSFSVIGKFKWRKVPVYILAQYIGSFIGCFLAWSIYFESIHGFDTIGNTTRPSFKTASIFVTLPSKHVSIWPAILDQVLSTGLLAVAILFISDENNLSPSPKLLQIVTTGFLILTFIIGFNHNCGAILNPARDLAPRVLLWMVGYGQMVFEPLNYKFWWAVGILGPHLGAIVGAILYHYLAKISLSCTEVQMHTNAQSIDNIQTKSISINSLEVADYEKKSNIMNRAISNRQVPSNKIFGNVNTDYIA